MAESNKIKNKLQIMLKKCLNINSCNALEYRVEGSNPPVRKKDI